MHLNQSSFLIWPPYSVHPFARSTARDQNPPRRRCLQIISPLRRTMIPEVFLQITVRDVLSAPPSSRKPPTETETSRNSLSWTTLHGTPLF